MISYLIIFWGIWGEGAGGIIYLINLGYYYGNILGILVYTKY